MFHGRNGVREDSDCFHLDVCQVAEVQVAGWHISLGLFLPMEVDNRYHPGSKEPSPGFSVRNVAIRLPNLCSIVSVTDSDTWVGVFFDVPSARVFNGWHEVPAFRQVSVDQKVRCECYILHCESGAFCDYLRSLLSRVTGNYTRQSLSSFSTLSVNPRGLHSGASTANRNIKIAHQYIAVVYLLCLL